MASASWNDESMARRRSAAGTDVADLTPDVYFRAYRLFCANKTDREIRRVIGLTGPQLNSLYHEGLPAKKGRNAEALPPFIQRLAEEDAQLNATAREMGAEVSRRGVDVVRATLVNTQCAALIVDRLLREIQQRLNEAGDGKLKAKHMPDDRVLQALAALRPFADLNAVANAWQRIYAKPGTSSSTTINNMLVNLPPGQEVNLPAAIAVYRQMAGDSAHSDLISAIAGEMSTWTPEQIERYALTGKEPSGKVIDVREAAEAEPPAPPA